jgi:hypothetical protein
MIGGNFRQKDGAHLASTLGEVDMNAMDADGPVTVIPRRLELDQQTDAARELRNFVDGNWIETSVLECAGNGGCKYF